MFPAAVRRLWAATGCEIKVLWINFKSPVTPCCAINAPDQLSAYEWVIFFFLNIFYFFLFDEGFFFFFLFSCFVLFCFFVGVAPRMLSAASASNK